MYRNVTSEIKKITLDTSLLKLHKQGKEKSNFGMDNSRELLDGGFGLYSAADLKKNIGPIKTEYFRIALVRKGQATFGIGLEHYTPVRNGILFGVPGQIFSLQNASDDFFVYYMLFTEKFLGETVLHYEGRQQFPFLTYSGVQCFQLDETTANEIEKIILQMNTEVKARKAGCSEAIRLYIQLIFIHANRNYGTMLLATQKERHSGKALFNRFLKLVSQHFLTTRKVADYAEMLHVSPDHLNRTIKLNSAKTANAWIDEMILTEAKAYLLHSQMTIAEIAYKLEFSDPSHFNKFFKKHSGVTPLQLRNQSE